MTIIKQRCVGDIIIIQLLKKFQEVVTSQEPTFKVTAIARKLEMWNLVMAFAAKE